MGIKIRFFLISILIISLSCRKDDNNPIAIEEADRTEQQVIDNDSLLAYFNSHYISNTHIPQAIYTFHKQWTHSTGNICMPHAI